MNKLIKILGIIVILIIIVITILNIVENVQEGADKKSFKEDDTNEKNNLEDFTILESVDTVYFDVEKGTVCEKTEYDSSWDGNDYSNSYTGYNGIGGIGNQNSCLKFYKYAETSTTQIMILDHNTTATVAWNRSGLNKLGPSTASRQLLGKLKKDTSLWNGTIEPIDYTYNNNSISYTVNYDGYKARIITANEIAKITGNKNWNEETTKSSWYYLDTLTTNPSSSCRDNDETTECKYGWLYDRTSEYCEDFGCLNNSDVTVYGYWTISSYTAKAENVWFVYCFGDVYYDGVDYSGIYGVRPVITISKS